MPEADDRMEQVASIMDYLSRKKPELQEPFMKFNGAVIRDGALPTKVKELIALSLSLQSTCEWCITYHTRNAVATGASRDEILEACYVAVLMAGAPALMHVNLVVEALEREE